MKNKSKFVSLMLALIMALFSFGAAAVAGTSDPYLMPYDEAGGGHYQYTHVLNSTETEAYFTFGPAIKVGAEPNAVYVPSYYSTEADALNVDFNITNDDGISGASIAYVGAFEVNTGQWATEAVIEFPDNGSWGAISVHIDNLSTADASTDITVARNEALPATDTVEFIWLQVYDPADFAGNTEYENRYDAPSNAFHENPNDRSYPTALDALIEASEFPIPGPTYIPEITDVDTLYTLGTGDLVTSMTVNKVAYESGWDPANGWYGWMYGIYRANGTPGEYDLQPISEHAGADCYRLMSEDLVMWKYGYLSRYGEYFEETYYRP